MNIPHLLDLANDSGGTLYLMLVLLLVALTVIIERTRYLASMQDGGERLIKLLKEGRPQADFEGLPQKLRTLPHARLLEVFDNEPNSIERATFDGHLEEVIMHEVPTLDRALWMLDTVITLAPLLGLFGTILGMFNAFHVLGDPQNIAMQVSGGIAEALLATASGLFVAMLGLLFFNALNNRIRLIVHQLETIKIMLMNRHDHLTAALNPQSRGQVSHIAIPVRA